MTASELLTQLRQRGVKLWAEGHRLRFDAPKGAVTSELRNQLQHHKSDLLRLLAQRRAGPPDGVPPLRPAPRDRPLALSPTQESLWFLHQVAPDETAYHVNIFERLTGPLDAPALQRAFDALLRRHEALRTTFQSVDGQPVQIVHPSPSARLETVDLPNLSPSERDAETLRRAREQTAEPFDLSRGPLLRATLLRFDPADHALLLTFHHTVVDGWSVSVLRSDLAACYTDLVAGREPALPPLPIQYADVALWQRQRMQGAEFERHLAYWKRHLCDATPVELPADHPRPAVHTYRGGEQSVLLPPALARDIEAHAREGDTTPFVALLAAFAVLLSRYTDRDHVLVGSTAANRGHPLLENLIGFFVNTLPLHLDVSADPSFRELLTRIRQAVVEAHAHQDIPFETLVAELHPERDPGRMPLTPVLFTYQRAAEPVLRLPHVAATRIHLPTEAAKCDLSLQLLHTPEGLQVRAEYWADLFEPDTMARLVEHYRVLLEGIAEDPARPLSRLPLLSDPERQQILVEWNRTEQSFPKDRCIHQLFEEQAARTPDALAVIDGDTRITYRELEAGANRLAAYLQHQGVGVETPVGICLERSAHLLVGILATLKAGGAYVPLDPADPPWRLATMMADAEVRALVTTQALAASLDTEAVDVVCVDAGRDHIAGQDDQPPPCQATPKSLAYIIYTSGSSGRPKGVAVEHQQLVARIAWATDSFTPEELAVVLVSTSICFDPSGFEIFAPLTSGGAVVLVENLFALPDAPAADAVTLIHSVPSVMSEFLRAADLPSSVITVCLGGEPLSPSLADRLYERPGVRRVCDFYGPTEATIYATAATRQPGGKATIGRPVANTTAYILDRRRRPVPVGVPGELYIGGVGVARGYVHRPDLTAEQFIDDPFADGPPARLYRTGDLARHLPDGNIVFLGRRDNQVKTRGFRVEPGEIEALLTEHAAVDQAVVLLCEHRPGDPRLSAFVATRNGQALDAETLRRFLADRLPAYMVPAAFVLLNSLPVTPNGKVDRAALLAAQQRTPASTTEAAHPQDLLERQMLQVWRDVLNQPQLGVEDNFFNAGGHSLLAVQLFTRLERVLGRRLPLASLFQAPTVRQLAQLVGDPDQPLSLPTVIPMATSADGSPLFLIAALDALAYLPLARLLEGTLPLYVLHPLSAVDPDHPEVDVPALARRYAHAMREIQPHGPYTLGGTCAGGVLAYEAAQELQRQGEEVKLLILVDSWFPLRGAIARINEVVDRLLFHIRVLRHQKGTERLHYLRSRWRAVLRAIRPPAMEGELPEKDLVERYWRPIRTAYARALPRYQPQPYEGRMAIFIGAQTPAGAFFDPRVRWRRIVTGEVETVVVPGIHTTMLREPHVRELAQGIVQRVQKARAADA